VRGQSDQCMPVERARVLSLPVILLPGGSTADCAPQSDTHCDRKGRHQAVAHSQDDRRDLDLRNEPDGNADDDRSEERPPPPKREADDEACGKQDWDHHALAIGPGCAFAESFGGLSFGRNPAPVCSSPLQFTGSGWKGTKGTRTTFVDGWWRLGC